MEMNSDGKNSEKMQTEKGLNSVNNEIIFTPRRPIMRTPPQNSKQGCISESSSFAEKENTEKSQTQKRQRSGSSPPCLERFLSKKTKLWRPGM